MGEAAELLVLILIRAAVRLVSENTKSKTSMNIKTQILTLTTCLIALAAPTPSFAAKGAKKGNQANKGEMADKAARPGVLLRKYDTDKNGAIDGSEIEALRKAFDADKTGPLKKLDTSADGTLDDAEVAAIKARHANGKRGKGGQRKKENV